MVEGHLNHPKICIASRYQKRTFEGTGITFKIISFLNLTLKTCQLWQMWVSVTIDKDLFTLSKLSTDSKSKLGSLMAHLQKLGCWLQLESSLPSPQSFGQKETPHPQSHKYISFNSADTTFKNVASIISDVKTDFIALLICCLCEQIVQLIIFLNYLHNRELTGTCYEQKTDKM